MSPIKPISIVCVLVFGTALSGCISDAAYRQITSDEWARQVERPPEQFQGVYGGNLIIEEVPFSDIPARWLMSHPEHQVAPGDTTGFALWVPGERDITCRVIIPTAESTSQAFRDAVLEHEIGHCNGWPADHRRS